MSDSEQPDSSTERLTPERYARVQALVEEAAALPTHARRPFLDQACGVDTALLAEAVALLAAHDALERGVGAVLAGTWIGPYCIEAELGRGGMGVVYLAQQAEPLRRRVALKLIHVGMDTRQVLERFDAERRALARMDHPNIAHIYDAGAASDGRPFFAMEYVAGVPITDYCDTHRLTTKARLALFADVCAAVQHAHQKGIIHRDLKPSNVLVVEQDERAVPKVIDFGIAKAIESHQAERSLFTELGQIVGTPEYMSPEQAALSADIDTTTDVYALGVLLYELLVGALPFDSRALRAAGYDEMRRIIRETDPPALTGKLRSLGNAAKQIANDRRTDPQSLNKQLEGDLDWIALKSMDKDRTRRYQSASELEADIERHLKREPVLACPPSTVYRLRRFVSRHRTSVIASASVLAALVLGIVTTASMYVVARSERQEARWQSYVSSIRAANFAARNEDVAELRKSLEACPPEHRGWEWNHLSYLLQGNRRTLDPGDWPWLTQAFFDHDSQRILAYSYFTGRMLIWNSQSLSLERTIDQLSDGEREPSGYLMAVSRDGRRAVVHSRRGLSRSSLVGLGQDIGQKTFLQLRGGSANVTSFSDDGNLVAVASGAGGALNADMYRVFGGADMTVEVFETRSAARVASFDTQKASIYFMAFDPSGRLLAIATETNEVVLLDVRTGRAVRLAGPAKQPLAFSPDGRLLAASGNGEIRVFDVESRKLLRSWPAGDVTSLTFTPDGSRLLSAARNTLRLWDTRDGRPVSSWLTDEPVKYLSFAPDGKRFISTSNSAAYVWDTDSTHFGRVVAVGGEPVTMLGPQKDGNLSVGFQDGTMIRFDTSTGSHVVAGGALKWPVRDFRFSNDIHPSGTPRVVASGRRGSIEVIPARIAGDSETVSLGNEPLWTLRFSGDGRLLAVVGGFGFGAVNPGSPDSDPHAFVRIFEWPSLKKLYEATLANTAHPDNPLVFSPDSRLLIAGDEMLLWRQPSPERIALANTIEAVDNVAFSSDGRRLAAMISGQNQRKEGDWRSRDEPVRHFVMWDVLASPRVLMKRQVEWFGRLTFSSDGTRVFTYADGGIQVWDASTLTPLISLESRAGSEYRLDLLSFDAFRQALVASTSGGEILIFRTRDGR